MPASNYAARPLSVSREYTGYQFYAHMMLDGYSAEKCFCYAALTIQNWLCERIANAAQDVPESFRCPPADAFNDVDLKQLRSAASSFAGIVSIPGEGIWSLWVREPDPAVHGRSFITHAAVRIVSGETVDFGVYIDIVDRDAGTEEAEFAFRPKFVRLLFQTDGLHMSQSVPLLFKGYTTIGSKKDISSFITLTADPDNQMPLIVFTHAAEKKPDIDEFVKRMSADPLPLQNPSVFPSSRISQTAHLPIQIPSIDSAHKLPPLNRKMMRKYGGRTGGKSSFTTDTPAEPKHCMPYDVAEFAMHTYGFGKVFVLADDLFEEFRARIKSKDFREGDILLIEPAPFGGAMHCYPFRPALSKEAYAETTDGIQNLLQRYSKRKPYQFGKVLFDEAARERLKELEFDALRKEFASSQSETEKRLLSQLEEEHGRSAALQQQVFDLRSQLAQEYQKGAASEQAKAYDLEKELTKARRQTADLQNTVNSMQAAFNEAKNQQDALENVRNIPHLPQTNRDVVDYFRTVYRDLIDFTDQGERTAAKCGIRPEVLWDCLYSMVTVLVEIHRNNLPDTEEAYMNRTGWEVSMCEGSQTRSNPNLMALRKDFYHGREISIEPHVKFDRSEKKTGAAYQRLYYCYDAETRMILVGYVGDHLENHSSLKFS